MSRAGPVVLLTCSDEATFIPVFHEKSQPLAAYAQCVIRCPVSRLVHSPGRPVSVITFHPGSRNHNTETPDKRAGSVVK